MHLLKLRSAAALSLALLAFVIAGPGVRSPAAGQAGLDAELARTAILAGVTDLADPGGPGRMVVWGDDAFSVANYSGSDERDPMFAAADWGAGRVIAMGDHQWLEMDRYGDTADTGRLYLNGIEWLTRSASRNSKIVVSPRTTAKGWLEGQGFTNVVQSGDYTSELADADLLVGWLGSSVSDSDLDTIEAFVTDGGGLFLADYGIGYQWWWGGDTPGAPGNRLLRSVGIGFSDDGTSSGLAPTRATSHMNLTEVLDVVADPDGRSNAERAIAGTKAARLFSVLPADDPIVAQLDAAIGDRLVTINPSPSAPVSDALDKAALTRESQLLAVTLPADVVAHRQADALYGSPSSAERVDADVTIPTDVPRWQPTGLFVAAGEVVTVTVPPALVGQGYQLRVNAHIDNISPRSSWDRPPIVHRSFDIDSTTIDVANAFGGLLFVDFGSSPPDVGRVTVQVSNAVEAPYFVLGEHTDDEWNTQLSLRPAPFSLLVSDGLMISLPTRQVAVADLTEPTALMTFWNDTVTLQDDLAAQDRSYPELANVDVQISYGAAHAGYPYQAYEKYWGNMADLERLTERGSWGDFHELGHNHQRSWWTFDGDVEVSVNIFANASLEAMTSAPSGGWAWSASPVEVIDHARSDVAGGGTYSSKSNRWSFWFQLADGFGWDAYQQVFADYEADAASNPAALPSTDAEEKDQWLVRFSKAVGYDMSPFMVDTWGLSVSGSARSAVAGLPDWMPLVGEPLSASTVDGASVVLHITAAAHSMGPAPTIEIAGNPAGTVTPNGDGTWTYEPSPGFAEQDEFTYRLTSSVGNTIDVPIVVTNAGQPDTGPVPGDDGPIEVMHTVTCLAGNGRVDTNIVNTGAGAATYRIEFEGLTARALVVAEGDWWRMPITGRPDRDFDVAVSRDGVVVSDTAVTVACDGEAAAVSSPEVQVVNACRNGDGYLLFQFANSTPVVRPWVIQFDGVPNRSTSAAPLGGSVRAVTGRPDGDHRAHITSGPDIVGSFDVTVDCDP